MIGGDAGDDAMASTPDQNKTLVRHRRGITVRVANGQNGNPFFSFGSISAVIGDRIS